MIRDINKKKLMGNSQLGGEGADSAALLFSSLLQDLRGTRIKDFCQPPGSFVPDSAALTHLEKKWIFPQFVVSPGGAWSPLIPTVSFFIEHFIINCEPGS